MSVPFIITSIDVNENVYFGSASGAAAPAAVAVVIVSVSFYLWFFSKVIFLFLFIFFAGIFHFDLLIRQKVVAVLVRPLHTILNIISELRERTPYAISNILHHNS